MSDAFGALAWFIAVLALIPLALWFLKRTPIGARLSQGPMKTVASLALSPSQRVVTVEVGQGDERRWLVLGVTPGSITTLHDMAPQGDAASADMAAGSPAATPFAQLLTRLRHREAPGAR